MVNLRQMFRARPARLAGEALYEAATRQARQPGFYLAVGAPDSPEGRFELYSLHVVLLLHRLKGEGGEAAETAQALFDAFVSALDNALREMGVGDLAVSKRMRRLGQAFYGRAKAYDQILAARDLDQLVALIGRTVFAGAPNGDRDRLAGYVLAGVQVLAGQPLAEILEGAPRWAPAPA